MDGGLIDQPSLQKVRTEVIDAGKRLIVMGGSCWQNFALGVNQYLVQNNTANYCWFIPAAPHFTVVDPAHPLAQGLPSPYSFVNASAAYYQIRVTDPNIETAAVNGDGFNTLFYKGSNFPLIQGDAPQVGGDFIWFINSPYAPYWTNAGDFSLLKQVVSNAIDASMILDSNGVSGS